VSSLSTLTPQTVDRRFNVQTVWSFKHRFKAAGEAAVKGRIGTARWWVQDRFSTRVENSTLLERFSLRNEKWTFFAEPGGRPQQGLYKPS
jgi:hypothetical protein